MQYPLPKEEMVIHDEDPELLALGSHG